MDNLPDGDDCTWFMTYYLDFVEVNDDVKYESLESKDTRPGKLQAIENARTVFDLPTLPELEWVLAVERDRVVRKHLRKLKTDLRKLELERASFFDEDAATGPNPNEHPDTAAATAGAVTAAARPPRPTWSSARPS